MSERDPARRDEAAATGELPLDAGRRSATPACRTSTRSKATSRTCRGSTSPTAPAVTVHPAPGTSACGGRLLPRAEERARRRRWWLSAGRRRSRRRAGRGQADAGAVEQRAPRRGQRLLHLGHRAEGSAGRHRGRSRPPTEPVPLEDPAAGRRLLRCSRPTGPRRAGRFAVTRTSFYVLGDGYTAWERYDHNRIDLVPERKTLQAGRHRADHDSVAVGAARPRSSRPSAKASASHRQFALTSTQQSIVDPDHRERHPERLRVGAAGQGRTKRARRRRTPRSGRPAPIEDASDPGKPAFRLGYVELKVEDATQAADGGGRAPTGKSTGRRTTAKVARRRQGSRRAAASPSEVTLWAVDYGVLSLTAYRTPDVLGSVYVREGAAGDEHRQPPAHHQPPRADAEGRHRRRRRRR